MKVSGLVLASMLVAAGGSAAQAADDGRSRITVVFVQPERFTDVTDTYHGPEREAAGVLAELEAFIQTTAPRFLPAGASLEVRVTNLDRAGDFELFRGPRATDVRIFKDIYPPRIDLEFRLTDGAGQTLREGTRELRDLSFLTRTVRTTNDRLRYEEDLLRDWLRDEFRALRPA
jgi:hypothetical protein